VSSGKSKRYLTPYIIGASDLAFILLFFFIMVGTGAQKTERIEMPFKKAAAVTNDTQAPYRVEIYDRSSESDSSKMALIFDRSETPETIFVALGNDILAKPAGYKEVASIISGFMGQHPMEQDSIRVDIFSSAYSYYGIIAIAIAACNELEYPCNLVYRTES